MKKLLKVILLLLFSVCSTAGIYAQRTVTGTVLDDNQQPVASANVVLKGTQIGALTDSNGKFTINVPSTGGSLLISFIGFTTQEVPIGTSSVLTVTLQTEATALTEIVVVGYGTQRRADVTGAISSVSSEKLNAVPAANLDQALQGRAAGLVVINNGAPGFGSTIRVRGISTVNDANPLFVVDGVVVTSINNLNRSDIESIEVLKDASTAAIYGSLGSNGVLMITTKKGKAGKVTVDFEGYYGVQYSTKDMICWMLLNIGNMPQAEHLPHLRSIQILYMQIVWPVLIQASPKAVKPIGRMRYTRLVLCKIMTLLSPVVMRTALSDCQPGI